MFQKVEVLHNSNPSSPTKEDNESCPLFCFPQKKYPDLVN